MPKRLEAVVSGRVQGVSFRYYTQRKAVELGVVGWVRNESDGTVRTVAEGEEPALRGFREFLEVGPPYAEVTSVEEHWKEATGEFERFRIVH
jgi:acylphosphatase